MNATATLLAALFFMTVLTAQNNDYDAQWQNVEALELEGKPKSALQVVEAISTEAKKEGNEIQLIKTLLFKSKFALVTEEGATLKVIQAFKTEIENARPPAKNVLENMLAKLYWDYFQTNRWKFYNRTTTQQKVDTLDFRTWGLETLFTEIKTHYKNSLKNGLLLQQTPIADYEVLVIQAETPQNHRPSLFDLLAHNAFAFFTTDENSIAHPAFKFEITDPKWLSPAMGFPRLAVVSKDSSSLQLEALKTYQRLISFHLKNNPVALANIDLERLQYVYKNARFPQKNELYLNALQKGKAATNNPTAKHAYDLETAKHYNDLGNTYGPKTKPEHQWKKKEALAIATKIIAQGSDSLLRNNARLLAKSITRPSVKISAERYVPIGTESLMLVNYKNH
ncbi:MAG: alpha-2-macroglobulin, partial [Marinirhabdus sp.]